MKKPSESDLIRQILEYLAHKKIPAWRANSGGGLRRGRAGRTVPVKGNAPGTPDVLGVIPPAGRFLGVEAKMPGGRLSPSQIAWHDNALEAGAFVVVAYSLGDLIEALREAGIQ